MNNNISQKFIFDLSSRFRKAVELAYKNGEFKYIEELRRFPFGSCGVTSLLLGEYLMEFGILARYVNRTYYYGESSFDSQSHTWLELNGNLIIDITGDQFKNNSQLMNYSNPVYVGQYNEFYNLFECTPNSEYELREEQILSNERQAIYRKIKEYL